MSKNGIGLNAKNQNGEANGSPVSAVTSPDAHVTTQNANDIQDEKTDPKKDLSTGESLLRMQDHKRQTEMILQKFRNS